MNHRSFSCSIVRMAIAAIVLSEWVGFCGVALIFTNTAQGTCFPAAPRAALPGSPQDVHVVSRKTVSGTITGLKPGQISIQPENGPTVTYKIQDKDEQAISIGGKATRVRARISVTGSIPAQLVERGMVVQFVGRTNVYGKCEGEIHHLKLLGPDVSHSLKVDFLERPADNKTAAQCEVVGRVIRLGSRKLKLEVPKAKWSKQEWISFDLADDCQLEISDDHLNRVHKLDQVTRAVVLELSTGDLAINEIDIALTADRAEFTTSYHEKLEQQFGHLSDQPLEPRELRSDNFILYTDASERNANILLAKLETMHQLIGGYFGARPRLPIECYMVQDLNRWPPGQFNAGLVAKILEPSGLTVTVSSRGISKSTVYSCADHAIVQHEAVHAFCAQTFGAVGPVWYAEGMAEMGKYWKPGETTVNIDPILIDFLVKSEPLKMAEIVAAGQLTGDSWQAYAWRWALCHMLATNPNYSKRFKALGVNLMSKKQDSFDKAFGRVAEQISFEYDQFIQNLGNGYQVDLCAWDWKTKPETLADGAHLQHKIKANRGWQATKLQTTQGVSYDFVTQRQWKIEAGENEIDGDGNPAGRGNLIGAIFHEFKLSEPFEMGAKGRFVAPADGQLFVRCNDSWTSLSDNEGFLKLFLRQTPDAK